MYEFWCKNFDRNPVEMGEVKRELIYLLVFMIDCFVNTSTGQTLDIFSCVVAPMTQSFTSVFFSGFC